MGSSIGRQMKKWRITLFSIIIRLPEFFSLFSVPASPRLRLGSLSSSGLLINGSSSMGGGLPA